MANLADYTLHSMGGKFSDSTESQLADVGRILNAAYDSYPEHGLVLQFHGGLVSKQSAYEIADSLISLYQDAGTYPVFFVWESSIKEALLNNKDDLLKDAAFRELIKKVSEWVLKKATGGQIFRGVGNTQINTKELRGQYDEWFEGRQAQPPVPDKAVERATAATRGAALTNIDDLATEIEAGFEDDDDFRKAMEEAYNARLTGDEFATKGKGSKAKASIDLLSPEAHSELFTGKPDFITKGLFSWIAVAKFVARVVIAVLKRHYSSRDHGAYCTIVEEVLRAAYGNLIGGAIWNQMKKDTGDSFGDALTCCGSAVIQQLKSLQAAGKQFRQLTLVGHSTGAIYACNFLDAAKQADLATPIKVIFLAPAVTYARFAKAINDHQGSPRLQSFRMFAMQDATECDDEMLSIIYTRSLLYFVSGLVEGETVNDNWATEIDRPLVGMQRYLNLADVFNPSDFPEVAAVSTFLQTSPDYAVWSPSNRGPGLNSTAHKHGDFDNGDAPTQGSVKSFIQGD